MEPKTGTTQGAGVPGKKQENKSVELKTQTELWKKRLGS